jgi:hypothetical protein
MSLIDRAKNILMTPNTEWPVIAGETATLSSLLTTYVLPLAAIPAIASFLAGMSSMSYGIKSALITYISGILGFVITTYVVDFLAGNFKSEKDINKSAQLVAYSMTASWVAGILAIVPVIGWLASIAGAIYAIYLMWLGVGPMKKTPDDQKMIYMVITFVVLLGVSMVVGAVLTPLLLF